MKTASPITALSFTAALALSGAASASITLNGAINPGEGWTQFLNARDIQVFIASDATNIYFAASTPDESFSTSALRVFDLNFGLDGNAAPARYRLQSRTQSSNNSDTGSPSAAFSGPFVNGWQGWLQSNDGTLVPPPFFTTDLGAGLAEYAVGMNGGRREHEFSIPWAVLLDGQNGWNYNSTLALRVAGFYLGTASTPNGTLFSWGARDDGGVTFNDQSTYALVNITTPIPAPGAMALLGLAGLAGVRRRR